MLFASAVSVLALSASAAPTTSVSGALGAPAASGPRSSSAESSSAMSLLDPLQAFRPQARRTSPTHVEVRFEIAPRYYLYRERLGLEQVGDSPTLPSVPDTSAKAGAATKARSTDGKDHPRPATSRLVMNLPTGKMIDDPTFGRVEVYEQSLLTTAAVKSAADGTRGINLVVTSQGCAAEGVCFPPQRFEFTLAPWRASAPHQAASVWTAPRTSDTLGFGRRASLPAR
jgi:thiol:disulfide interchange protein DsbD